MSYHLTLQRHDLEIPVGATGEIRLRCPLCSHQRKKHYQKTLSFNTGKGVGFCHHCEQAIRLDGRAAAWPRPRPLPPKPAPEPSGLHLWQRARPLRPGDPVTAYLARRAIVLPHYPETLRYLPRLRYQDSDGQVTEHPGMLALVQAPSGDVLTIHRTYLTATGDKAAVESPKKLYGAIGQGAAIRLFPPGPELALAEGIETALAVHLLAALPVWATISAQGMETIVLPAEVQRVYICVDCDADRKSETKGRALATRLVQEGRAVSLPCPLRMGEDWADVLMRERGRG